MSQNKLDIKIVAKKLDLLEMRVKELEGMNIKHIIDRLDKMEDDFYMLKDVFTFPEACKYLDMSPSQLYKLTYKLKIPHYKPNGKKVYFDKVELIKWMKRNPQKEIMIDESENETK